MKLLLNEDQTDQVDTITRLDPPPAERPQRERSERSARSPRTKADTRSERVERTMVRLQINLGRNDQIRPADIVGAIANESGLPGRSIGEIEIRARTSVVEVPRRAAQQVLQALNRTTLRGQRVRAVLLAEAAVAA